MAILQNKFYGYKIFLSDLNKKLQKEIQKEIDKTNSVRAPNFAKLIKFDNQCVGIVYRWQDIFGYEYSFYENSKFSILKTWSNYHQPKNRINK